MAAIEKVKVVVLGDSGVGKTSLTYLIAHNKPLLSPGWTVGCSVEVKLHKFKEGTQAQNTFFVELWDVGGSNNHRNTRNVFYQPTHGIILVHDLTNRKSQINLQKWLSEILNQDTANPTFQHVDVDPEQFLGSTQIPILVIGTKFDLAEEKQRKNQYRRLASSIAEQCGADEIFVNCFQARSLATVSIQASLEPSGMHKDDGKISDGAKLLPWRDGRALLWDVTIVDTLALSYLSNTCGDRSLAPGTSNSVKLTRFFDKVIERRYYSRASPFSDKRRIPAYMMSASTPITSNKPTQYLSPRFYHMD